ncbi:RWD domain-containing protein 1, partial [Galemys pyrenaicus]
AGRELGAQESPAPGSVISKHAQLLGALCGWGSDEAVQTALKLTCREEPTDEIPLYEILPQGNLGDTDASEILKGRKDPRKEAEKPLFYGVPVGGENVLPWEATFEAELLEIKKKRIKEEQAGEKK